MMCGWVSRAAATASLWKRSNSEGSSARSARRIFTATIRANTSSRARHTSAIPPVAMSSSSTYRPASRRSGATASMRAVYPRRPAHLPRCGPCLAVGGDLGGVLLEESEPINDEGVRLFLHTDGHGTVGPDVDIGDGGAGVDLRCRRLCVGLRPIGLVDPVPRVGAGPGGHTGHALRADLGRDDLPTVVDGEAEDGHGQEGLKDQPP